ncbi:MAG: hypothetical protein ACR2KX_20195, partial [Chitinophagaceae bacterium]
VTKGRAFLIKKDIFRNIMWYTMPESTKHYPVSIDEVKKIQSQNRQGIKPDALETVEVITGKPKEIEPEFVDVVGQISLRSLEKNTQKRRTKERGQQNQNRPPQNRSQQTGPQGGQQQQKGPQQGNPQNRPKRPPQQRTQQKRPPQNRPPQPP